MVWAPGTFPVFMRVMDGMVYESTVADLLVKILDVMIIFCQAINSTKPRHAWIQFVQIGLVKCS